MPTESELTDALVSLEDGAPTVAGALASMRLASARPAAPSPHRWLLAGAAAALVLLTAIALATVGGNGATDHPASGPAEHTPQPLLARQQLLASWHFTVAKTNGYTVTRDRILREGPVTWIQQGASVVATKGHVTGRVVLQQDSPGGYVEQRQLDLQRLAIGHGQIVTVNGRQGYFVPGTRVSTANLAVGPLGPWEAANTVVQAQPTLIWELPRRAWAMLQGTFGFQPGSYDYDNTAALATMTKLANATGYVAHQPVTMPFRLKNVPPGLVPEAMRAYSQPVAQCLGYGTGRGPYPTGSVGSVITVCRYSTHQKPPEPGAPQSAFQSLLSSGKVLASRALTDDTTLTILAAPTHPKAMTTAVATQLLQTADVTPDFTNTPTWKPVT